MLNVVEATYKPFDYAQGDIVLLQKQKNGTT